MDSVWSTKDEEVAPTRWMDTNQGKSERPSIRTRDVGRVVKANTIGDCFVDTPPFDAVKRLIPTEWVSFDVEASESQPQLPPGRISSVLTITCQLHGHHSRRVSIDLICELEDGGVTGTAYGFMDTENLRFCESHT